MPNGYRISWNHNFILSTASLFLFWLEFLTLNVLQDNGLLCKIQSLIKSSPGFPIIEPIIFVPCVVDEERREKAQRTTNSFLNILFSVKDPFR